jgi:hypothetical protein
MDKDAIVRFLENNRVELLQDKQFVFCAPCGGMTETVVYRSPKARELGMMLDVYQEANKPA